jgi:hypothetical protein
VLALYSPSGFVKVFVDAREGLVTVCKVSDRFITIHRSRGQLGASSYIPRAGL